VKILVTGGAGFIGSHIVDRYVADGHKVTVLDNLSSGKKANLHPKAKFVKADIRSPKLNKLFKAGRFDVLNHHAAQMDVRRSVQDPEFDASVNVHGFLNLLRLAKDFKVKKVIFAASGGTYYGECSRPAAESCLPNPLSPYGVTKLAGEAYVKTFSSLYGFDFTVFRYGNVFGPRQDPHGEAGVVAIFTQRMLAGEPVFIFGNGKQRRDYVFVSDVAQANVLALRRGRHNVFNIGTQRATSVNELFAELKTLTGYPHKAIYKPARPGELFRSVLNVQHARKLLGWKPQFSLTEALQQTVDYFETAPRSAKK